MNWLALGEHTSRHFDHHVPVREMTDSVSEQARPCSRLLCLSYDRSYAKMLRRTYSLNNAPSCKKLFRSSPNMLCKWRALCYRNELRDHSKMLIIISRLPSTTMVRLVCLESTGPHQLPQCHRSILTQTQLQFEDYSDLLLHLCLRVDLPFAVRGS